MSRNSSTNVVRETTPRPSRARRGLCARSSPEQHAPGPTPGLDISALAGLIALWALVLVWRYDAMPLQLWDESRNANNALEMAEHGRWLIPTFAGTADHWNTKPPLLIWAMAALLKSGLPPLAALRLPSWLAAAATTLTLWSVLRHGLKDGFAGFASGVLVLTAALYIGPHGARTGDYDALESAWLLGYVLAAWWALETGRAAWLLLCAALMGMGVLTKGVAALLPLPGLCLYAASRGKLAAGLLRTGWTWAAAGLFVAMVGGYYLARETYDPGYLSAVAGNELGGRFLKVTENHRGAWDYYLRLLFTSAQPCAAVCGAGVLTAFSRDGRRRRLVRAAGAAAASILVVLSASSSKMSWYATPLVPLLALIGGLGLSDGLGLVRAHRARWSPTARAAVALTLGAGIVSALWWSQSVASWRGVYPELAHLRYGELFQALQACGDGHPLTVVDTGFANDAGFRAYDPMLRFYAEIAVRRGLQVHVAPAQGLAVDARVASCDARSVAVLRRLYRLAPIRVVDGCLIARIAAPATPPA